MHLTADGCGLSTTVQRAFSEHGVVFVRDQRLSFHTVLTPHSLEFQGNFWSYDFGLTNLPGDYFSPRELDLPEPTRSVSLMRSNSLQTAASQCRT